MKHMSLISARLMPTSPSSLGSATSRVLNVRKGLRTQPVRCPQTPGSSFNETGVVPHRVSVGVYLVGQGVAGCGRPDETRGAQCRLNIGSPSCFSMIPLGNGE